MSATPPFTPLPEGAAPAADVFRCALCGHRFTHGGASCARCPFGGCDLVECPRCGYRFPRSSRLVEWLRRLFVRCERTPSGATTLDALRPGDTAIVRSVAADAARLTRLSSLGLLPGVELRVEQRHPATVVRIGETTLALDAEVARSISVELEAAS